MNAGETSEAERFVIEATRALASCGTPAHRLEEAMGTVAAGLGLEAEFFAMPTSVFVAVTRADGTSATTLLRTQPSDVNAERLVRLDDVLERVHTGSMTPAAGRAAVRDAVALADRYGPTATAVSIALSSACVASFFGGGLKEVWAALAVGFVVGGLAIVSASRRELGRLIDFASGLVAVLGASVLSWAAGGLSVEVVTLAGVIILLPGLSLTIAINELATRHLASGGARLVGAIAVLVSIGFGVAFGGRVAGLLEIGVSVPPMALPEWAQYVALAVAPVSLGVLFRVPPRFLVVVTVIGASAFLGARFGAAILGPELGVSVGALVLGCLSNLYCRLRNRPVALVLMPGIILLVPGSIGFRSISSFVAADAVGGVEAGFSALLVAVSLVAGLLVA
ncbi:MAG: threonine/serine exporter family protein, partial [Planctomycetota bacterium]